MKSLIANILFALVILTCGVATASPLPLGFEINLEISDGDVTTSSSATVEEGVEGTLTTRNEKSDIQREIRFTVVGVSDRTAALTVKITESSTGKTTESYLELEYGKTGSMTEGEKKPRTLKATIHRLTNEQMNDVKASVGAAPSCGAPPLSAAPLSKLEIPTSGVSPMANCCSIYCSNVHLQWTTCCNVIRCCSCGGCCSPDGGGGCPGGPCP